MVTQSVPQALCLLRGCFTRYAVTVSSAGSRHCASAVDKGSSSLSKRCERLDRMVNVVSVAPKFAATHIAAMTTEETAEIDDARGDTCELHSPACEKKNM